MINYYLLTKPGIILGNLIPLMAGFLLASKGNFDGWLFLATLLGLSFVMASGCVLNNVIDLKIDKKMDRTQNRPLVKGLMSHQSAIGFASILGLLGGLILFYATNLLTLALAGVGFFVYVVLYSLWKCHTVYGTAIGSIAGAIPPVVGYCAVSNRFDLGAFVLFMMMVLWQMPHFFSIALYHLEDYRKAHIPVLPVIKGVFRTKIHMIVYIALFILASALLTYFKYTGYVYLLTVFVVSLTWLLASIAGFRSKNTTVWGKQMFYVSLVVIMAISAAIPLDLVVLPT